MSMFRLKRPGKGGPCLDLDCLHEECAYLRFLSERACLICGHALGYDRDVSDTFAGVLGGHINAHLYAHNHCLTETIAPYFKAARRRLARKDDEDGPQLLPGIEAIEPTPEIGKREARAKLAPAGDP